MKKKVVSVILAMTMVASMAMGCGNSSDTTTSDNSTTTTTTNDAAGLRKFTLGNNSVESPRCTDKV